MKYLLLLSFLFVSILSFGQNATSKVKVEPTKIENSDLPEQIKGVIDATVTDNMLSELLMLNKVFPNVGELHEAFFENPVVLAKALISDPNVSPIFRQYITTEEESVKLSLEDQLFDLY
jgi:hypothetical protein